MSKSIKILIADDESIGRQLLEAILMPEGYDLLMACDGREAFETALKEVPDFILLDVMMPHMDGFEVCKRLRKEETTAHIPVFLITALDDRDSKIRGIDAGADDYISKPFDRIEILAKIKNSTNRIKKQKTEGDSSNGQAPSNASSEVAVQLQKSLLELLITNTTENVETYNSPVIPVTESQHCYVSIKEYGIFLSNKLEDQEAALANSILLTIWKNTLANNFEKLNELLVKCIEAFNAFIQERNLEILAKAGFAIALIRHNKELNEIEACGVNQTLFIQSNEVMIGQADSNKYQSYYLQGNQSLKFPSASSAILISPNAFKFIDQQEFLNIANNKLNGTDKGNFIKEISELYKQSKDICAVKITF